MSTYSALEASEAEHPCIRIIIGGCFFPLGSDHLVVCGDMCLDASCASGLDFDSFGILREVIFDARLCMMSHPDKCVKLQHQSEV